MKETEHHFGVMETKMLHWINGNTHFDHVHSDDFRQQCGIAPITGKGRGGERGEVTSGEDDDNDDDVEEMEMKQTMRIRGLLLLLPALWALFLRDVAAVTVQRDYRLGFNYLCE
ncbi:hypothetical protein JRQ81_000766 [Phrynocephalus forsythii]|uniref:Uncharacterized protein n=1 Tax=Phrynocephalus forsythii TaxID=171643 RepID=A0A9Q0Y8A1_9SAUR|nr:hypothetical protein JRQ81_000766 [Phrynocephalus forsythii]